MDCMRATGSQVAAVDFCDTLSTGLPTYVARLAKLMTLVVGNANRSLGANVLAGAGDPLSTCYGMNYTAHNVRAN